MRNIEILITTYRKTDREAIDIVKRANIFCDCIIRNQCGKRSSQEFNINGYRVLYICADDIGLSKNRNELLKLATSTYVMFLDDDCIISNIDKKELTDTMFSFDIVFTSCISLNKKRPLPVLKNHKSNNKFKYYSGCGIVGCLIKLRFIRLHCIFFDENIGSGTKLLCGEDSVFIKDVIQSKGFVGISNSLTIQISQDDSIWFSDVLTDEYIYAKGYLYKKLYKTFWFIYGIRFLLLNKRNKSFLHCLKTLCNGSHYKPDINTVGVFSICDNNNYGNRLQNFALVYYLNETFNNVKAKTFKNVCTEYSFFGLVKNYFNIKKDTKFTVFSSSLPSLKRVIYRGFNFDSLKDVDYILVGSDQVWNEQYFGPGILTNMLKNCVKKKRISYAISVGKVNQFVDNLNAYLPYIEKFENLSFRETEITYKISDKTNLSVSQHIDPVLLLKKETWLSMVDSYDELECSSYFVHFLNKEFDSSSLIKHEFGDNAVSNETFIKKHEDPFDLVKFISRSKCVFTDSYHVFLFSLILNKDIYLFVRDGVSDDVDDRFKTIICLFNLSFEKKTINHKPCFIFRFSKLCSEFYKKLLDERDRSYLMFNNEFKKS